MDGEFFRHVQDTELDCLCVLYGSAIPCSIYRWIKSRARKRKEVLQNCEREDEGAHACEWVTNSSLQVTACRDQVNSFISQVTLALRRPCLLPRIYVLCSRACPPQCNGPHIALHRAAKCSLLQETNSTRPAHTLRVFPVCIATTSPELPHSSARQLVRLHERPQLAALYIRTHARDTNPHADGGGEAQPAMADVDLAGAAGCCGHQCRRPCLFTRAARSQGCCAR